MDGRQVDSVLSLMTVCLVDRVRAQLTSVEKEPFKTAARLSGHTLEGVALSALSTAALSSGTFIKFMACSVLNLVVALAVVR